MAITIERLDAHATAWQQIQISGRLVGNQGWTQISFGGPQQRTVQPGADGSFCETFTGVLNLAGWSVTVTDQQNQHALANVTPTCPACDLSGITGTIDPVNNSLAQMGGRILLPFPPLVNQSPADNRGRLWGQGTGSGVMQQVPYNQDGTIPNPGSVVSIGQGPGQSVRCSLTDWFSRQYWDTVNL